MKPKSTILTLGALVLVMAGTSLARTWTSANGKATFEGEFVSASGKFVTVKKSNGSTTRFTIDKLSEEDIAYVKEQVAAAEAKAKAAEESAKLKSAPVPKAIAGKLHKLSGKRLKKAEDPEVIPKYYFLAYTASW